MSMLNKRPLKKLLGLGAFACASAVLLSVTAQSARIDRIPTVSEVGSMIGGTFRFVQTLREEAAAENADPSAETGTDDGMTALQTVREFPSAPEESPAELPELPDLTDLSDLSDLPDLSDLSDLSETDELSSLSDSLSLSSADPSSAVDSLQSHASASEIVPDISDSQKAADEAGDWMAEELPADGTDSADGADGADTTAEGAGQESPDEQTESAEAGSSIGDFMETDDGGEELVAAASVTLSLQADNRNHAEYLHGYEDGTARPGGKITRAEACQILYNLLSTKPANRAVLKDVKDSDWFAEPVRLLAAYGVIDTPNDKARPTDYMTRAELVSALSRLVAAETSGRVTFTDVPASHPYYAAIAKAVGLKWVNGYEDGTFKPDGSITRAEAAKVVNRALSRTPDEAWIDANLDDSLYSDLTKDHWAYYELMEASVAHAVSISDGKETWDAVVSDSAEAPSGKDDAETEEEEEETHEGKTPESTGWTDEELERMLSEPLPDPVDPDALQFEGSELFAVNEKGEPLKNVTLGRYLTFDKDGRYTSGDEMLDSFVKGILDEVTTEDMTREEKLKAAYEYVRDNFDYRRRNIYEPGESGWEVKEALTMYDKKKGNCYNYTAAFAMLARRLGYDAEAVSGLVGSELQSHGWVEIIVDGERLLFDTTLECSYRDKGINYDFFGMRYAAAPWPYHKH